MTDSLPIHNEIRARLEHFYITKKIPHILFYGENGCGKKTLVMDFIHLIYNHDKQKIKQNTLFSNCSHSKGIKHIRENLKEYSRSNVRQDGDVYFKTIILYNFENLSVDGQSALRRVIEAYSQTTRFFLILQNKQKILQPILSRFAHIYVPLPRIDGAPTNLYTYHLARMFGGGAACAAAARRVGEILAAAGAAATPADLVAAAETIYSEGLSCVDLMEWIRDSSDDTHAVARTAMYFQKIKSEYRNETMLLFTILEFWFLRVDKNIYDVGFM